MSEVTVILFQLTLNFSSQGLGWDSLPPVTDPFLSDSSLCERHQINVFDALKLSHTSEIIKHMKEVMLKRNPVNIINVVKLL